MVANLQHIMETTGVFLKAFATHALPFAPQTLAPRGGLLLFSPVLLAGRVKACATAGDTLWWRRCKWIRVQLRYFSYRGCAGNGGAVAEAT